MFYLRTKGDIIIIFHCILLYIFNQLFIRESYPWNCTHEHCHSNLLNGDVTMWWTNVWWLYICKVQPNCQWWQKSIFCCSYRIWGITVFNFVSKLCPRWLLYQLLQKVRVCARSLRGVTEGLVSAYSEFTVHMQNLLCAYSFLTCVLQNGRLSDDPTSLPHKQL